MNDLLANLSLRESQILAAGILSAFAACFKLAAYLYRRTTLTWPNAFLVMGVVLFGSALLSPVTRGAPLAIAVVLGLAIAVALGALTLKFRAKTASGDPLANADAVKISAIGYSFLSIVIAALLGLLLAFADS